MKVVPKWRLKIKTTSLLSFVLVCNFHRWPRPTMARSRRTSTYYLPNIKYNAAITSPASLSGISGRRMACEPLTGRDTMKLLAAESDRVDYTDMAGPMKIGPHHPPHQQSFNLAKKIRFARWVQIKRMWPKPRQTFPSCPWFYTRAIPSHGNEASGVNAAMLVAYYLAAGESEMVAATLDNCFILSGSLLQPGWHAEIFGLGQQSKRKNLDHRWCQPQNSMKYGLEAEPTITGLTSTADWLLLVQPESRAESQTISRLEAQCAHRSPTKWAPHATFFFNPVPSRTNRAYSC